MTCTPSVWYLCECGHQAMVPLADLPPDAQVVCKECGKEMQEMGRGIACDRGRRP